MEVGLVKRIYIENKTERKKRMKLIAEAIELLSKLRKIEGKLKDRQLQQLLE